MLVQSLGWVDPLEEGMATHPSVLAWRIPWTEEPGRLRSMRSQRAGQALLQILCGSTGLFGRPIVPRRQTNDPAPLTCTMSQVPWCAVIMEVVGDALYTLMMAVVGDALYTVELEHAGITLVREVFLPCGVSR